MKFGEKKLMNQTRIPSPEEAVAVALAKMAAARPPAPPEPETPEDNITRLQTHLATLRRNIQLGTEATTTGDVETASRYDLKALAAEVASTLEQLEAASKAKADLDYLARSQEREDKKKEFALKIAEGRSARAEFQKFYELAAAALGRWCTATERAIALNHETVERFCPDPEQVTAMADLENRALLCPLNTLMDAGFAPVMNFGFDLWFRLPPLIAPENKKEK
jgi:hypothetical protein